MRDEICDLCGQWLDGHMELHGWGVCVPMPEDEPEYSGEEPDDGITD